MDSEVLQEREIPIPSKLVKKLTARRAKTDKTCGLVLPTSGCNPKLDLLACLNACAGRAKLDTENFWLHKFRSTFATRCLWPVSISARSRSGWAILKWIRRSRYLKRSRSQQVRDKVNEIFA
jgi:hypothetical protein